MATVGLGDGLKARRVRSSLIGLALVCAFAAAAAAVSGCGTRDSGAASAPTTIPLEGGLWRDVPALASASNEYQTTLVVDGQTLVAAARTLASSIAQGALATQQADYVSTHADFIGMQTAIPDDALPAIEGTGTSGFSGLARVLWSGKATEDRATASAIAQQLIGDVQSGVKEATTTSFSPFDMESASVDLLGDMERYALVGQDDPLSGTDLADMASGVEMVASTTSSLSPFLSSQTPSLQSTVTSRLGVLRSALSALQVSPGDAGSGYPRFGSLSLAERLGLSGDVEGLAEVLSHVIPVVDR